MYSYTCTDLAPRLKPISQLHGTVLRLLRGHRAVLAHESPHRLALPAGFVQRRSFAVAQRSGGRVVQLDWRWWRGVECGNGSV